MTQYTFCETIAAFVWHIRKVEDGKTFYGGAAKERFTKTLCDLQPAWDINVSIETILIRMTEQDSLGVCNRCAPKLLQDDPLVLDRLRAES